VLGSVEVTTAVNASYTRLVKAAPSRSLKIDVPPRGDVVGFSAGSRLSMLKLLNSCDSSKIAAVMFVTMTAPPIALEWSNVEAIRCRWIRRVRRKYPGQVAVIWKKEPHKSGRPHLHALLFWMTSPPRLADFRSWNDTSWSESVACGRDISRTSCRVELMNSFDGVKAYCAKYCSKSVEVGTTTGRIWGVVNRKLLPITFKTQTLQPDEAKFFTRALLRYRQASEKKLQKFENGKWSKVHLKLFAAKHPKSRRPRRLLMVLSPDEELRRLRAAGVKTRIKKPRLLWTRNVEVWSDETDERGRKRVVRDEWLDEKITEAPRTYFLASSEIHRLIEWAKLEASRRRSSDVDIPF